VGPRVSGSRRERGLRGCRLDGSPPTQASAEMALSPLDWMVCSWTGARWGAHRARCSGRSLIALVSVPRGAMGCAADSTRQLSHYHD